MREGSGVLVSFAESIDNPGSCRSRSGALLAAAEEESQAEASHPFRFGLFRVSVFWIVSLFSSFLLSRASFGDLSSGTANRLGRMRMGSLAITPKTFHNSYILRLIASARAKLAFCHDCRQPWL